MRVTHYLAIIAIVGSTAVWAADGKKGHSKICESIKTAVSAFQVVSASRSQSEPILDSMTMSVDKKGRLVTQGEHSGVASPVAGRAFVVVNWELKDFSAPKKFQFPQSALGLIDASGAKIAPFAVNKLFTEKGLFWFSGTETSIHTSGGKVTESWLFILPESLLDKVEVQICDRKIPLEIK